ncbi:hypothetical protein COOONC_19089 [Cooperia oncophora]
MFRNSALHRTCYVACRDRDSGRVGRDLGGDSLPSSLVLVHSSHEKGTKTALSGRTSLEPVSSCKGRHQLLIASNFLHISQPKPLSARPPSTPTGDPFITESIRKTPHGRAAASRSPTETVRTECSDSLSTDRTYDRLSSMDTSR